MTTYTTNFNFPKPAFGASSWHTDMYAFMDSVDAMFLTFLSIDDMTGPWQNGTAYTAGQVALDTVSGGLYNCLVNHTSAATGTFSADRAANPSYWEVSAYSARALAEKWADEEEDVPVETGKYSAKHWAAKAAAIVGAFGGATIIDADSDTFVKTEASSDEDKVRINTAGVERVVIDASGLNATTLLESGTALASKYAAIAHESDTANPHSVTKTQVGLANVTNDAQLKIASNLGDLTNAGTARSSLGIANHQLISVTSVGALTLPAGQGGVAPIGAVLFYTSATAPTGWLRVNGETIGSAASGATYASSVYEQLYIHLWDNFADAQCPVSSGRGASAAADWAANKTLTLFDSGGRALFGLEPSATRLTSGSKAGVDGATIGASGGVEEHQLTPAEMPIHNHAWGNNGSISAPAGGVNIQQAGGAFNSTTNAGGDEAHTNLPPALVLPVIIKY